MAAVETPLPIIAGPLNRYLPQSWFLLVQLLLCLVSQTLKLRGSWLPNLLQSLPCPWGCNCPGLHGDGGALLAGPFSILLTRSWQCLLHSHGTVCFQPTEAQMMNWSQAWSILIDFPCPLWRPSAAVCKTVDRAVRGPCSMMPQCPICPC